MSKDMTVLKAVGSKEEELRQAVIEMVEVDDKLMELVIKAQNATDLDSEEQILIHVEGVMLTDVLEKYIQKLRELVREG